MTDITAPLSPAELVVDLIDRYGSLSGTLPSTGQVPVVVAGPLDDDAQQGGGVSVVAAGLPEVERFIPLEWHRAQIRCLGPDLDTADFLSRVLKNDLHGLVRKLAYQASNDTWYLVHKCDITAGPSHHFDTAETQEGLLFATLLIATVPVATGPTAPF